MNMPIRALSIAFAVAATLGTATAQEKKPLPPSEHNPATRPLEPQRESSLTSPPAADFGGLDRNSDGQLDATEFAQAQLRGATLAQVDADRDGRVSRIEWSRYRGGRTSADRR
ncbi:MAG TPA: hypothetical protein VLF18_10495 [Tahibacter sp.]|uniref:hypothetical protein n=1 Tax=Tahibacter sp. TaxID=2056211 RepID=UPI002B7210F7|nr:hypothetical protein [Tahibacter sp.]HSX60617.1 hypothetical protein [Tahibacter sp.]